MSIVHLSTSFRIIGIADSACDSASNLDPGRWCRKPLNHMLFLQNRWGHGWTPIKSRENLQFRCGYSRLDPRWGGVQVGGRFTDWNLASMADGTNIEAQTAAV